MNQYRFGSFARGESRAILEEFSQTHDIAKGALAEFFVLALTSGKLPPETVAAVIQAGKEMVANRIDGRTQRARLISALKGLTNEQLSKLVEATPQQE